MMLRSHFNMEVTRNSVNENIIAFNAQFAIKSTKIKVTAYLLTRRNPDIKQPGWSVRSSFNRSS
jgi:hypothetical protein